jgi:hypothetical protein
MLIGLLGPVNDQLNRGPNTSGSGKAKPDQLITAKFVQAELPDRGSHAGLLLLSRNAKHVGGIAAAAPADEVVVPRQKMLVGYGL